MQRSTNAREETAVLQRAFTSVGPMRVLRHVQEALLSIPRFVTLPLLLDAVRNTGLCLPEHAGMKSSDAPSLSIGDLPLFATAHSLSFYQFLDVIAEVKRVYHAQCIGRDNAAVIDEAVEYVVDVMGNWNNDEADAVESTTTAQQSQPASSSPVESRLARRRSSVSRSAQSRSSSERLAQYLEWFGVLPDSDTTNELGALLREADDDEEQPAQTERDDTCLLTSRQRTVSQKHLKVLRSPSEMRLHAAVARNRAMVVAMLQPRLSKRSASPVLDSLAASITGTDAPSDASPRPAVASAQTNGPTQVWLSPEFDVKGHGPRGSFFTRDTPPTGNEWDSHQRRMVEASRRHGAKQHTINVSHMHLEQRDTRSLAEKLRLPQLTVSTKSEVDEKIAHDVPRGVSPMRVLRSQAACSAAAASRRELGERSMRHGTNSATSSDINRMIDETYRKARDLGISSAKATSTVGRRLAGIRRQQREVQVEHRRQERAAGFRL